MSQENVEIIKAMQAAINRGDWDAVLTYMAPSFKIDTSRDLGEWRGVYETPARARRALEGFYEPWESWRIETDEFIQISEDIIVTRQTGYLWGRDGIEVTTRTSAVWTFREGAVTEFAHYNELEGALEAARRRE